MSFIDDKIKNLNNIYEDLKAKIDTFKDGEISNLSKKMDSELNSFYLNKGTIFPEDTSPSISTKVFINVSISRSSFLFI